MKGNNLPDGWSITKIESICYNPQYGYTTSASSSGNIKFLRTTDITSGKINWDKVPFCKKNPDKIEKYLLKKNDIVISRAGSIGFSYILDEVKNTIFASYLIRFRPLINPKFFYYFLHSSYFWESIYERKIGIAIPNINATKLKQIVFPLSPLNEQKRIVTKIESIFAQIDATKEKLETLALQKKSASASLNMLRSSILKQAFEGKLVPQDPNDESAETFFRKIHKDPKKELVFEIRKKMPEKWFMIKLEDVCLMIQSGFAQGKKNVNNGVIHLRMNNISIDFKLNFDLVRTIKNNEKLLEKYKLNSNDIIFNNTNSPKLVGKSAIFNEKKTCLYSNHLTRIQVNPNFILSNWLLYFLQLTHSQKIFEKMCVKWINQAAINQTKLKQIVFPLPPLNEQKRIVTKIESIFAEIDAYTIIIYIIGKYFIIMFTFIEIIISFKDTTFLQLYA